MPIAQKYNEGHFTKQQYKEMILEDIKKKTLKNEEKDMDVVHSLVLPDHPELSVSSPPVAAVVDDVVEEIKIPEEKKETNSWGSGRLQKTLDIKEITEPVVEVSLPPTMEQKRETTPHRGSNQNPRTSLLRPVHKNNNNNNNNHRQRDSDRRNHTNPPPESGPHPVKRVSMLRPKMDNTNINTNTNTNTNINTNTNTTYPPVLNASRNSNHLPNPRNSSHNSNSNSGGQMTSPRPSQTPPNNNNNDRRNHRNNNKMRPQPAVTGSPTSSTSVPLSTTATASPRKDLLCRFLASKHGPNDWEKCTRSHSMDEWVPKECRHDKKCSRPGCGFFHKSKDTKQTYLLKLMSVENSFYHNHTEDFKKLYLK
jgi:hypothetical protein